MAACLCTCAPGHTSVTDAYVCICENACMSVCILYAYLRAVFVLCVHVCECVFGSVHTCTLVGNRAGFISTDAVVRCLFALSPEWIDTGKSMNGCG